jgi:hypothetical protein
MVSVTLVRTISFSVYQKSKYTYAAWFKRNFGLDPLVHVNTPGTCPNLSTLACFGAAGATAGSFITLVACKWNVYILLLPLTLIGPFELTKVSAQVSVLMAHKTSSVSDATNSSSGRAARAVASSYQNKGTFQTAKNIIKHRGIAGLYSGFNLHLRKQSAHSSQTSLTLYSERYVGYLDLLYDLRE